VTATPRFADGSTVIVATPTFAAMPASLSGGSESYDNDTWDSAEWEQIVKALVPFTPASGSEAAPASATPATPTNQATDESLPWVPASDAFYAAPLAAGTSATESPVAEDGTAAMDDLPMMQMFAAAAAVGLWSQRIDIRAARRLMTAHA
jgi:hypothetical protein